jgi:hypothetical protein
VAIRALTSRIDFNKGGFPGKTLRPEP